VPIGHLDIAVRNTPQLGDYAACRQLGAIRIFDAALTGHELAVERALCVCRGCPAKGPCKQWASTLGDRELRDLGVVAGQNYTTPPKRGRSVASESSQDRSGQPNRPGMV
jgi:hypothetical protein